jgi:hypothetical protein
MPVDIASLNTDWWRPHFNAADRAQLIALEYLGSEDRAALIRDAFNASILAAPENSEDLVEVTEFMTIAEHDKITLDLWFEHMTTAERDLRKRLGADKKPRRATEVFLGSHRSTFYPTPTTAMCWETNRVNPFRKGYLIDIPPRHQPTMAKLKANLTRSRKAGRVEGVKYPGFTLAVLDDGYPYDYKVLSTLCEQVSNDLMINEPTVNINAVDTYVLMWAARCFREGVRP